MIKSGLLTRSLSADFLYYPSLRVRALPGHDEFKVDVSPASTDDEVSMHK
jgi:hypothetical protein